MVNQLTKSTTVADVMTREIVSVDPSTPIRRVLELMTDRKIAALPVIEHARVVGIVTSTDLMHLFRETNDALHKDYPHYEDCLWAVDLARQKLDASPVREIMSFAVSSVSPSATVHEAAKRMSEDSIHHLCVFDDDELIGLVSSLDLVATIT